MTRAASPKLAAYAGLAALGLLAGLALGRPELVVLGAPFALTIALGVALAPDPLLDASLRLDRERVLEGEEVTLSLELETDDAIEHLELLVGVPEGLEPVHGSNPVALHLPPEEPRSLELRLRCDRWGGYLVGDLTLRARDRFGLFVYDGELDARVPLKVYPRAEALREVVRPAETQGYSGNQVSRHRGEGIEFADLRPFAPGDRVRRVNWRASARRQALWVNQQHPERNAEIVVFLDSFTEVRRGDSGTLDLSVRVASSLLAGYVGQRDRIAFVSFGGILRWLMPGTGLAQLYRIVDALLDTEITLNYAWKDLDVLPARTLPPQALVVAVTPLLDERAVSALLDLRGRGFDLVVVEISPVPFAAPAGTEVEDLARRLWLLRRDALRARYQRAGIAVVEWREGVPLALALEEVTAFRRSVRHLRA
ncbi:MAG: DUF58 domain-containing protein [Gaiellaceae bacterium]